MRCDFRTCLLMVKEQPQLRGRCSVLFPAIGRHPGSGVLSAHRLPPGRLCPRLGLRAELRAAHFAKLQLLGTPSPAPRENLFILQTS